jgi:predicted polyphosphate/ATP-dependent NAD kinase
MSDESVREALKALQALGITHGYKEYEHLRGKMRIGLIVNPVAGMGGRVGLKGTDGDALKKAIELGAEPVSPSRAVEMLTHLSPMKKSFRLITYGGDMGENEAREAGFEPEVIDSINPETTSEDTVRAASMMSEIVDLLVFVGGDGTARDVLRGLKKPVPVIGIPSGVKMYSGVFAVNPKAGADLIQKFIRTSLPVTMAEVMDIDENEFRKGKLSARIFGYFPTPYDSELTQSRKIPSSYDEFREQLGIARYFVKKMNGDIFYILGPGTTTFTIGKMLGVDKTLLGVDVVHRKNLVAKDVNEGQLLSLINGKKAAIVVTPIGGQGFIFGRGNQQISPDVIRKVGKENIIVVSTKGKLRRVKNLRVDTGDPELDEELTGKIKVITGYMEETEMMIN